MIQKRWMRHAVLAAIMVIPVLTAGCGLFSKQTSQPIDPPQAEMTDGEESEPSGQLAPSGETSRLTVYLQDINGYLAPIAVPAALAETENAGHRALEMMVEDGAYAAQLPDDFRALLPQGTQILSYDVDAESQIAQVNFSEAFNSYNEQDERAIVEAITWTLTAMTNIRGVEVSVEGEKLAEMPVAGYPLDGALTRSIGINIETAEGVSVSHSYPVTLYFSAETLNDEQYYVPVTRLVARSDSPALAALEQLIEGPLNKKALSSVILPDVQVDSIENKENGVLLVNLLDEAYESGIQVHAEMLEAIILSLTETTNALAVQISLNGETEFVDDRNITYSEPVTRKNYVNAFES